MVAVRHLNINKSEFRGRVGFFFFFVELYASRHGALFYHMILPVWQR